MHRRPSRLGWPSEEDSSFSEEKEAKRLLLFLDSFDPNYRSLKIQEFFGSVFQKNKKPRAEARHASGPAPGDEPGPAACVA
ncbi:hypothetical protein [Nguyenibacter sp. L1]|uniref:hypothetical protein n=1 Tax=Nguyenibacter sp. L1 TaxID=3049350 RepID=UPI002B4716A6|nr:hypothetical protein [Nguyenibacter sp. L1]WRH88818.1 hypothetical protein QN315_04115 [Nguyenibacter sp. L1]